MPLSLLLRFALLVAPHVGPTSADSMAVEASLRDAEFLYLMDWRHEWESWRVAVTASNLKLERAVRHLPAPPEVRFPGGVCIPGSQATDVISRQSCLRAAVRCDPIVMSKTGTVIYIESERFLLDLDQHDCPAHIIRAPLDWKYSLTPFFVLPVDTEPPDEALGVDNQLPPSWRDTVQARRARLLRRFDSAAAVLPGDGWLAGQRVRLSVDQDQLALAMRAASACRAAAWWCAMLRGYVRSVEVDVHGALAAFDSGRRAMPRDTLCRWDDVSMLLPPSARAVYTAAGCAGQVALNATIWWLSDPLYIIPDNERRESHYARAMLGVLHGGAEIDEHFDMRDQYNGQAVKEMVLRYGWPTSMLQGFSRVPPGWGRFDTHAIYLGMRVAIRYWGPVYHTVPSWSTVVDPLHATDAGWELAPQQFDSLHWDSGWWAEEFYRRTEGPLVGLSTQIAFLRRHGTAVVAAAVEWQSDVNFVRPPTNAIVGVATSGGPNEKIHVVSAAMDGAHPRAILTPIESRPLLLGVEMVPRNDVGAAGRTRFGVSPPPPLRELPRGTIALSDAILLRTGPGQGVPATVQETLTRMYGSTRLVNPGRIGVFWEVYGQGDHDTVDVAVQVIRADDSNVFEKAGSLVGLGHTGPDTLTVGWHEPRAGDAAATVDSGATIRPRGEVIDFSSQPAGSYSLSVTVTRHGVAAQSAVRTFTVVRK